MTTGTAFDFGPPEVVPPRPGSLEARASLVLKALAAINLAGIVLAMFPQPLPQPVLEIVAFNVAAAALAVLEVVLARALDQRRTWAVASVRPVLALLIAGGIGAMLTGAQAGRTRVPFEAVLAIWAMVGASDATLARRADGRSALTVAAGVMLLVAMVARQPLFGWGGVLDASPSDLQASIYTDCGAADVGPPAVITVTYDWSWARATPLPSGLDIVVLGWNGADAHGRQLYYYDAADSADPGVYPGRRDYPSDDMASRVAASSAASYSWGVELGEQGMRPGRVELRLVRPRAATPGAEPLAITASYVHLGVWHSAPVAITCSWSGPAGSSSP